jgi:chaperonin GroES
MMIEAAKDITAVKDILTGDSGDKTPATATTTLAMIEQGLKVFTAIYKRVYRALKNEFRLLFALNAKFLTEQEYFTFFDTQLAVSKTDYNPDAIDVVPVADPRMVTDMQKAGKAQFIMGLLGSGLLNDQAAIAKVFEWMGIDEAEQLINPPPQGPPPELQAKLAETQAKVENFGARSELDKAKAVEIMHKALLSEKQQDHDIAQAHHKAGSETAAANNQLIMDAHAASIKEAEHALAVLTEQHQNEQAQAATEAAAQKPTNNG